MTYCLSLRNLNGISNILDFGLLFPFSFTLLLSAIYINLFPLQQCQSSVLYLASFFTKPNREEMTISCMVVGASVTKYTQKVHIDSFINQN